MMLSRNTSKSYSQLVALMLAVLSLTTPVESFSRTRPRISRAVRESSSSALQAFFDPTEHRSSLLSNVPQDEPLYSNRYSAGDWLHNVFTLPRSSVLRDIRHPVLTIAVWSTLVSVTHKLLLKRSSQLCQKLASDMCIGGAPHSFLVSSLGLLLVFRTNSAYQRFNEGRKIWEQILSISRNISRMVNLYGKEVGRDRQQNIINLVAAFPYLLRHHVRPGCLCENSSDAIPAKDRLLLQRYSTAVVDTRYEGDRYQDAHATTTAAAAAHENHKPPTDCWVNQKQYPWRLLEKASLKKVARAQNRPLWVCDRIGRQVMDIPYSPNFTSRERLSLLSSVEKLTNTVGQCERIHQTAVPLNYARHSLRSLTLWLVTLPFALVKDMGFLTGPTMAVISWLLFGVYQIGYSIEDPFQGSLRLSILCDAIRRDVMGETDARHTAFEDDEQSSVTDQARDELLALDEVATSVGPKVAAVQQEAAVASGIVDNRVEPIVAEPNQAEVILNQPSLVKENGTWVMAVE